MPAGDATARSDFAETGTIDDGIAAGEALAAALDLELLPREGGLFRSTFTGGGASAILYMLIGGDFSAMHRLSSDEIYFHHSGSPLRMLLIDTEGVARQVVIGPDALVVSPGFDWHDFVLGDREQLVALCPDVADRIEELTRPEPPL